MVLSMFGSTPFYRSFPGISLLHVFNKSHPRVPTHQPEPGASFLRNRRERDTFSQASGFPPPASVSTLRGTYIRLRLIRISSACWEGVRDAFIRWFLLCVFLLPSPTPSGLRTLRGVGIQSACQYLHSLIWLSEPSEPRVSC